MFITAHAEQQLRERLTAAEADECMDVLEERPGVPGLRAIVVRRVVSRCTGCGYHRGYHADDCDMTSNGDMVVAIVDEGSVNTVMYRRSGQPLTPEALGVRIIEDWSIAQ